MTLRQDRNYPVRLRLRHAAVQEHADSMGLVTLREPRLRLGYDGLSLEGSRHGATRRWHIPYRNVIESRASGPHGLYLFTRSGERFSLDVMDRDEWLAAD